MAVFGLRNIPSVQDAQTAPACSVSKDTLRDALISAVDILFDDSSHHFRSRDSGRLYQQASNLAVGGDCKLSNLVVKLDSSLAWMHSGIRVQFEIPSFDTADLNQASHQVSSLLGELLSSHGIEVERDEFLADQILKAECIRQADCTKTSLAAKLQSLLTVDENTALKDRMTVSGIDLVSQPEGIFVDLYLRYRLDSDQLEQLDLAIGQVYRNGDTGHGNASRAVAALKSCWIRDQLALHLSTLNEIGSSRTVQIQSPQFESLNLKLGDF